MSVDRIEAGVELLRELVGESPRLEAELEASRAQFYGGVLADELDPLARTLAERRHFEWFAFERPTEAEGIPAAHELFDAWLARADGETQLSCNALLHSRSGIFEVAGLEPGSGLWLNDLLGHASFPVDEPEAAAGLAVGDLLAGRIFPIGDSQFRLSPAVACFRNPDLREAIRRDLTRIADGRRGTLRIAQIEIERMFFGRGGGRPEPGVGAAEAEALGAELTELLTAGGIERERAEAWVESLREAAEAATRIGESGGSLRSQLLEGLAFDTEVDLERARDLLARVWDAFARGAVGGPVEAASPDAPAPPTEEPAASPRSTPGRSPAETSGSDPSTAGGDDAVRRALENYDRGRAAGQGLDQLFETLERELGLDSDEVADDDPAPDFPGVVAAMVAEYAWERERGGHALEPAQRAALDGLGEFTSDVGLFDALRADQLVDYAARWSLDRGRVRDADAAVALLAALEGFARWADEEHELHLWADLRDAHAELVVSLPRVAEANAALGVGTLDVGDPQRVDVVEDLATERVGVRDGSGEWRALEGPEAVVGRLRQGDQVSCRFDGDRALPLRCYPSAARGSQA